MKKYLFLFSLTVFCFSCQEPEKKKPAGGFGTGEMPDSFFDPARPSETQKVQHADPLAPSTGFEDRAIRFADSLLGMDFGSQKPELGDDLPKFEQAKKHALKKFVLKSGTSGQSGAGNFPRMVFLAWEFTSPAETENTLLTWLNTLQPGEGRVEKGRQGIRLKFPPCMGVIEGNSIFYIKTACIFQGEDWQRMRLALQNRVDAGLADLFFEIRCGGGALEWKLKN